MTVPAPASELSHFSGLKADALGHRSRSSAPARGRSGAFEIIVDANAAIANRQAQEPETAAGPKESQFADRPAPRAKPGPASRASKDATADRPRETHPAEQADKAPEAAAASDQESREAEDSKAEASSRPEHPSEEAQPEVIASGEGLASADRAAAPLPTSVAIEPVAAPAPAPAALAPPSDGLKEGGDVLAPVGSGAKPIVAPPMTEKDDGAPKPPGEGASPSQSIAPDEPGKPQTSPRAAEPSKNRAGEPERRPEPSSALKAPSPETPTPESHAARTVESSNQPQVQPERPAHAHRPAQEPFAAEPASATPAPQAVTAVGVAQVPASSAPTTPVPSSGRSEAAVPISGVAIEITARVRDGQRQFDIRLDPPELGRIDVRLHLAKDGAVTSHLIVDRPETLQLLRQDSATLERALQSTGLRTEGGLEFSLRDQSSSGGHQASRDGSPQSTVRAVIADETTPPPETGLRQYGRLLGLGGGIDIRI